jgi:class 3 adenylate cyclase
MATSEDEKQTGAVIGVVVSQPTMNAEQHRLVVADTVAGHRGKLLETSENGFLAVYETAAKAVASAVEYAVQISAHAGAESTCRAGLHWGEAVSEGGRAKGKAADTARELREKVRPGWLWFSSQILDRLPGKLEAEVADLGVRSLELAGELRIYETPLEQARVETREQSGGGMGQESSFLRQLDTETVSMDRLGERFPKAGTKVASALERLARKGVLSRRLNDRGEVEYSLTHIRNILNVKRLFEKESEEQPLAAPDKYRIGLSVLVTVGGLIVILPVLLSILTRGIFVPILLAAALVYWLSSRRTGEGGSGGAPRAGVSTVRNLSPDRVLSDAEYDALSEEAVRIGQAVGRVFLASAGVPKNLRAELAGLPEAYAAKLQTLIRYCRGIDKILDITEPADFDRELDMLEEKIRTAESEAVKEDYKTSAREVAEEKKSYEALKSQRAAIIVRVDDSLSFLKAIQRDFRGMTDELRIDSVEQLRRRSSELSDHLDKLKTEYERFDE